MRYLVLLLNIALLPSISAQSIFSLSPAQESALASAQDVYEKSMASDPGWSSIISVVSSEIAVRYPTLTKGPYPQTVIDSLFSVRPDVASYYLSYRSLQASVFDSITANTATATASTSSSLPIAPLTTSTAPVVLSSIPTLPATSVTSTPTPTPNVAEARVAGLGFVGYAAVVGMVGAGAVLL